MTAPDPVCVASGLPLPPLGAGRDRIAVHAVQEALVGYPEQYVSMQFAAWTFCSTRCLIEHLGAVAPPLPPSPCRVRAEADQEDPF